MPKTEIPHLQRIVREMLEIGTDLTTYLRSAANPPAPAEPPVPIVELADAFHYIARAIRCGIRLDITLAETEATNLNAGMVFDLLAAIGRDLEAAAKLLPDAASRKLARLPGMRVRAGEIAERVAANVVPLRPRRR